MQYNRSSESRPRVVNGCASRFDARHCRRALPSRPSRPGDIADEARGAARRMNTLNEAVHEVEQAVHDALDGEPGRPAPAARAPLARVAAPRRVDARRAVFRRRGRRCSCCGSGSLPRSPTTRPRSRPRSRARSASGSTSAGRCGVVRPAPAARARRREDLRPPRRGGARPARTSASTLAWRSLARRRAALPVDRPRPAGPASCAAIRRAGSSSPGSSCEPERALRRRGRRLALQAGRDHHPRRDRRVADERRRAVPLRLESVDFLLQNDGRHHRFALRAEPPRELRVADRDPRRPRRADRGRARGLERPALRRVRPRRSRGLAGVGRLPVRGAERSRRAPALARVRRPDAHRAHRQRRARRRRRRASRPSCRCSSSRSMRGQFGVQEDDALRADRPRRRTGRRLRGVRAPARAGAAGRRRRRAGGLHRAVAARAGRGSPRAGSSSRARSSSRRSRTSASTCRCRRAARQALVAATPQGRVLDIRASPGPARSSGPPPTPPAASSRISA